MRAIPIVNDNKQLAAFAPVCPDRRFKNQPSPGQKLTLNCGESSRQRCSATGTPVYIRQGPVRDRTPSTRHRRHDPILNPAFLRRHPFKRARTLTPSSRTGTFFAEIPRTISRKRIEAQWESGQF